MDPQEIDSEYKRKASAYHEKELQLGRDYQPYDIPSKVKERASQIYMLVLAGDTFKRGRRRAMMCKCAYEAFKENNIWKDPILLAKMFDVDVKKLRDAQDEFYARIHGTDLCMMFPKRHLTAKELLEDIAQHLNVESDDNIEQEQVNVSLLHEIIDKLYDSSILMSRVSPRDIAISVVHWYRNGCGQKISVTETQKITMIARAKLVKIVAAIEPLVNLPESILTHVE